MPAARRVVLAGQDRGWLRALGGPLARTGHVVAYTPGDGIDAGAIDLVALDTPPLSPARVLEYCATVRRAGEARLLLTNVARGAAVRARSLDAGADVALVAPTAPAVALAQIGALLRRLPPQLVAPAVRPVTPEWSLEENARRLIDAGDHAGRVRPLGGTELRLLHCLLEHAGVPVARATLLASAWGPGYEGADAELDLYVHRLRGKIEPTVAKPRCLRTVRGVGYLLERMG